MICSTCQRDANDNPVAYYFVQPAPVWRPDWRVWKCWTCMSTSEKLERDGNLRDPRRFKMQKTIKETERDCVEAGCKILEESK